MSPLVICLLGLVAFFILMSQGMPIAFCFALVGFGGIFLLKSYGAGLSVIGTSPYVWAANSALLPVPLFVLMGQFMYHSGLSSELYTVANKWMGRRPGGAGYGHDLGMYGLCRLLRR